MDGGYGNAFQRNFSPIGSNSSPNDQYKTNVSRQKTKKWVEAKTQSYDGDDWGNEYDETPDEEEPTPPPQAPGSSQFAPPSVPFAAQEAGQLPTSRASPSPVPSPGLRGQPPLHIQTQQSPAAPQQYGSGSARLPRPPDPSAERHGPEHVVSPDSAPVGGSAAASSVYSTSTGYPFGVTSPASQRRMSPAPQSAGPHPARFPPRKSSIGQQDLADFSDRAGSGPGSRPASRSSMNQRPWMEPRASSPGGPRTPSGAVKALPFIRPADIYKRMEEEREKERRRSMESSRHSMDSQANPVIERTDSPSRIQADHAEARLSSLGKEDVTEPSRSARPNLPPVAERKSEYGFERLIEKYAMPGPEPQPEPETTSAQAEPRPASVLAGPKPAPEPAVMPTPAPAAEEEAAPQKPEEPEEPAKTSQQGEREPEEDESKRFSNSPKLPDLARMSGFGTDFFGGAPIFMSESSPPTPSIPDEHRTHVPPGRSIQEEKITAAGAPASTHFRMDSPTVPLEYDDEPDAAASASAQPKVQIADSVKSPAMGADHGRAHKDEYVEHPALRDGPGMEATEAANENQHNRIQTASVAVKDSDNKNLSPSASGGRRSLHSGEVSPLSQHEEIPDHEKRADNKAPLAAGDASSEATSEEGSAEEPPRAPSPHRLQPLRTASPAPSPLHQVHSMSSPSDDDRSPPPIQKDTLPKQGSVSTPDSAKPQITPTAPLNPRRSDMSPVDLTTPGIEQVTTMSTVADSSPVKESDKLSAEIIKSLSPTVEAGPGGSIDGLPRNPPKDGPTRESTYLHDVYDDYWAPTEAKVDEASEGEREADEETETETETETDKDGAKELKTVPPVETESPLSAGPAKLAVTTTPSGAGQAAAGAGRSSAYRRFSWETGSEEVDYGSPDQESLPTPQGAPRAAEKADVSSPAGPIGAAASKAVPQADANHLSPSPTKGNVEPSGISHQVSQASTLQPGTAAMTPEPPSPVSATLSVTVDDRTTPMQEPRVSSLADEKNAVQVSSNPVSPTAPPIEMHPALAPSPSATSPLSPPLSSPLSPPRSPLAADMVGARPSPVTTTTVTLPTKRGPVNVVPFRQILEMPSTAQRIRTYDETRAQFASIDSGLGDWLAELKNLHPDLADETALFNRPQTGQVGGPPNTQQPYYQQYLNASTPNLQSQAGPRHLSYQGTGQPGAVGSDFRHSNQVGVKGKELLMAAGKAGKGLLSKGKNKLRGTGDKVFF